MIVCGVVRKVGRSYTQFHVLDERLVLLHICPVSQRVPRLLTLLEHQAMTKYTQAWS